MRKIDFGSYDLFAVPMSLSATKSSGSFPGMMLSITLMTLMILYLTNTLMDMMNTSLDKYDSQTMAIDFTDNHQPLFLKDFSFMPSLSIDLLDPSLINKLYVSTQKEDLDIWKGNISDTVHPGIDIEKFNRYI